MNYKTQKELNLKFVDLFKQTILDKNIDTLYLINHFNEFEKHDIDDCKTKEIIKIMIEIPYYENLKQINILKKFKILKNILLSIHNKLLNENLNKRLYNLRN